MSFGGENPFGQKDRGGGRHREQLAATIKRELESALARGLADPRVKGLITVTGAAMSEDQRVCEVTVSVMPEEQEDLTMHGLRAAAGHLRKSVMGRIRSRAMPRLEFVLDRSIKTQGDLMKAFVEAERTRVELEETSMTANDETVKDAGPGSVAADADPETPEPETREEPPL